MCSFAKASPDTDTYLFYYFRSGLFLLVRQKPFSSCPTSPIGVPELTTVLIRVAIPSLLSSLAWFYGLTLCGPLRTVLVTEHPSIALLTGKKINCDQLPILKQHS